MDFAYTRLVGLLPVNNQNLRNRRKYDYHSANNRLLSRLYGNYSFRWLSIAHSLEHLTKEKEERINIPWLLIIGILVQFGWEAGLFLGGIRSAELGSAAEKLAPMIINSLLETNLGMPYIFAIFIAFSAKFKENLKKRTNKLTFFERIIENNSEKVKNTETSEYLDI